MTERIKIKENQSVRANPTSYQLDPDLKEPVDNWLKLNKGINKTALLNAALREYITQEHTLGPVEIKTISSEKYETSMNKMIEEHQDALDKLK